MSANIPAHFVQTYSNTVQLLSQQMNSRLEPYVMSGFHEGEKASPVDQWGKIEALENTERFSEMPRVDDTNDRRWIIPRDWDLPQLVSPKDLLRVLNDPKSALARAAVAAMNRKKDKTILDGLLGTNFVGKDGTATRAFPASQSVGVNVGGTNSNLNVAKLRAVKVLLGKADVDLGGEEIYMAVNTSALDSLLNEIQVVSKDYNVARDGSPILKDGIIERFLGINFIQTEQVYTGTDDQGGTSYQLPFWVKSGAYLGKWRDVNTRMDERTDLRDVPTQIYTRMTLGATRLEEVKVGRVWARQS